MTWWQYLLLVNIYLLLFYGFYALLLSRETFFQLNRIYLVTAALLSLFIPMIQADWVKNLFITQKVQYTLYSSPVLNYRFTPVQDTHFTVGQLLTVVYLAGITFLALKFVWQLIALKRIINKPAPSDAYSFFKKVKLGDEHENNEVIAAHENVHADQWHSADVLIMEGLMIINWFNPIVYFYRFAIKHIHEFIADRQAVKSGTDKADYAMILLSQTFNAPAHRLVNPFFNKSLLKQRIIMLQKNKSHQVAIFKYFLSAPLFILMLVLSSATVNSSKAIRIINSKVERVFLIAPGSTSGIRETSFSLKDQSQPGQPTKKPNPVTITNITLTRDTTPKKDGPVFTSVEQVPEFPGGLTAFSRFLSENIRYPQGARDKNVQGRVIISFIVETDGTLTNFRLLRGIGDGADEEAIRVLALSPKWSPGLQNGHKVRVAYSVPISFTLSGDKPEGEHKTGAVDETNSQSKTIALNQPATPDTAKTLPTQIYLENNPDYSLHPPLYIVDGVQVDNLALLDPNNIQSISVTKEKSKTALYGEKARYGVVIITTKKNLLKLKPIVIDKN